MSQRERARFRGPREADLEKELRPSFKEYEEWRSAQIEGEPEVSEPEKKVEKKKPFGKMDVIFIVLGVLAGLIWQSCKAAGQ